MPNVYIWMFRSLIISSWLKDAVEFNHQRIRAQQIKSVRKDLDMEKIQQLLNMYYKQEVLKLCIQSTFVAPLEPVPLHII